VHQGRLLELVATGAPLRDALLALTATATELDPDVRAAVVVTAPKDGPAEAYAAHLPAPFIEHMRQPPAAGADDANPCAAAMRQGARVDCTDSAHDAQWSPTWRAACLAAGVGACLSTPIVDIEGKAVGSFFMGLSRAERNWAHLLALADFGARLAGIAVANA